MEIFLYSKIPNLNLSHKSLANSGGHGDFPVCISTSSNNLTSLKYIECAQANGGLDKHKRPVKSVVMKK